MPNLNFILYFILFIALELIYFKIANHFNIIDKPNHRSSHTQVTIRGGGIIFAKAVLIWFLFNHFQYPYFIIGLMAISLISFLDDVLTLNNKIRLSVHLFSVLMLFIQWQLFDLNWYWIAVALIFVIATINAYNFMDGINGITGAYSLLTVITLFYINENIISFTSPDLLIIVAISLLVFNFFNFRNRAKCFAGDVGSVSIAFIIIFLIGQLALKTQNIAYIFLLLIYGLDTSFTVLFRKIRRENIFEAHRSHFYQFLTNHLKWSHLWVSFIYTFVQATINIVLLLIINKHFVIISVLVIIIASIYVLLRFCLEGKNKLLVKYS